MPLWRRKKNPAIYKMLQNIYFILPDEMFKNQFSVTNMTYLLIKKYYA